MALTDEEERALGRARDELLDEDGVRYVSLGVTADGDGSPEPAIWVHSTGPVAAVDDLRDDASLPIVVLDLERQRDAIGGHVDDPEPDDLNRRAATPAGGHQVGPNPKIVQLREPEAVGGLGTLGMLGRGTGTTVPSGQLLIVSAAHVFADDKDNPSIYSYDLRQPESDDRDDVIGRDPVKSGIDFDLLAYQVVESDRDWGQESRVERVGTGRVTSSTEPLVGESVSLVGRTTGLSTGTITAVTPRHFQVQADDPTVPLSAPGDSGGPWITAAGRSQNPEWVGIHRGSLIDYSGPQTTYTSYGLRAGFVGEQLGFELL